MMRFAFAGAAADPAAFTGWVAATDALDRAGLTATVREWAEENVPEGE